MKQRGAGCGARVQVHAAPAAASPAAGHAHLLSPSREVTKRGDATQPWAEGGPGWGAFSQVKL